MHYHLSFCQSLASKECFKNILTPVRETHHLTCAWHPTPTTCFSLPVGFFLTLQPARPDQPGNSWPSRAVLNQHTSFMGDIYLRNIWTIPSGIRTHCLWYHFAWQCSLCCLPSVTLPLLTLFSVPFTVQTMCTQTFVSGAASRGIHLGTKPNYFSVHWGNFSQGEPAFWV